MSDDKWFQIRMPALDQVINLDHVISAIWNKQSGELYIAMVGEVKLTITGESGQRVWEVFKKRTIAREDTQ